MKKLFLIVFILICGLAFGQIKYKNVSFKKGMPSQIKFNWVKAEYANIDIGNFYKNLIIICKDTNSFSTSMYYVLVNKNGGFSISGMELKQNKIDEYSSILELKTTSEDKLSPLNIRIYLKEKRIEYNWEDSANEYSLKPKVIDEYKLKVGKPFPSLSLKSQNGIVDLDTIKGKIIVINWWATSCVPCVGEIPGLNKLVEKYKNKPVMFLSIVWDRKNLEMFLKEHPFNYRHLYSNTTTKKLLGGAFPRNIIIDKNHKIIYNKLGALSDTWKVLDKIINSNL